MTVSLETSNQVRAFYQEKFDQHGPTPQGMAWNDEDVHYVRLSRIKGFLDTLDIPLTRVLDVGCGIGLVHNVWDLWDINATYHGVDLVPEFVEEARARLGKNPNAIVTCEDFLEWSTVDHFSATLAIGTFAWQNRDIVSHMICLLYTSDAADERSSVDLG